MQLSWINNNRHDRLELLLYGGIWLGVLLFPLISVFQNLLSGKNPDWFTLQHDYVVIIPFFILFYINTAIFIPYFLVKGHTKMFFLQVLILLVVFGLFQIYTLPPRNDFLANAPVEMRNTDIHASGPDKSNNEYRNIPTPSGNLSIRKSKRPPRRLHHSPIPGPVIVDLVIAILIIGVGIGIKAIFNHFRQEHRIAELEKEQMKEKMDYLKAQLSPHFFMNILNNIHGMVELNPSKAQKLILEMSGLLRYVLYESSASEVSLKKEIDFVKNYISLMKSRYSSKKVSIECKLPHNEEIQNISIPPLLFIVFIENAFKHGISYRNESFIRVGIEIHGGFLTFICSNSMRKDNGKEKSLTGGLGLKNVRKRLAMLFEENFSLLIESRDNHFNVMLNIPINEN